MFRFPMFIDIRKQRSAQLFKIKECRYLHVININILRYCSEARFSNIEDRLGEQFQFGYNIFLNK